MVKSSSVRFLINQVNWHADDADAFGNADLRRFKKINLKFYLRKSAFENLRHLRSIISLHILRNF
jgi:hypothetical protein